MSPRQTSLDFRVSYADVHRSLVSSPQRGVVSDSHDTVEGNCSAHLLSAGLPLEITADNCAVGHWLYMAIHCAHHRYNICHAQGTNVLRRYSILFVSVLLPKSYAERLRTQGAGSQLTIPASELCLNICGYIYLRLLLSSSTRSWLSSSKDLSLSMGEAYASPQAKSA